MREFLVLIAKCIAVAMPVIAICFYARFNVMKFADEEVPYYQWNKEFCSVSHDGGYDVVVLGDSVANAAYVPDILSSKTVNLSLGGTTPMENYYVMRQWLENNPAPKDVFISFMDHHMNASDCFWKRTIYFHRFGLDEELEMYSSAKRFNDASIIRDGSEYDLVAYELGLPDKYITALINGGINQRWVINMTELEEDSRHGGRYIAKEGVVRAGIAKEFTEFFVGPLYDEYYRKLIGLCIDAGSKVHLVKTPLPDADAFTKEFELEFEEYYASIASEYPAVSVDRFDGYDISCFLDGHHLSYDGALRFSEELRGKYPEAFSV